MVFFKIHVIKCKAIVIYGHSSYLCSRIVITQICQSSFDYSFFFFNFKLVKNTFGILAFLPIPVRLNMMHRQQSVLCCLLIIFLICNEKSMLIKYEESCIKCNLNSLLCDQFMNIFLILIFRTYSF
jgi:hypothetical protein